MRLPGRVDAAETAYASTADLTERAPEGGGGPRRVPERTEQ